MDTSIWDKELNTNQIKISTRRWFSPKGLLPHIERGNMNIYLEEDPPGHPITGVGAQQKFDIANNQRLQEFLWNIWRLDKTRTYKDSRKPIDADKNGTLPPKGTHWTTPRELIAGEFTLAGLDIWKYNREQLKRQGDM